VGLAVAKGLALASELPLVLVPSLEALAHDLAAPAGALAVPCLDAGKGQVYARLYRVDGAGRPIATTDGEWVLEPQDLIERMVEAGAPLVTGGTGVDRYLALFRAALGEAARASVAGPSAEAAARLALPRLQRGETDDLAAAVPSYGRPPDITRPKPAKGTPPDGPLTARREPG
jgi:tRNA threonylcarbamoyladenosine biosynthesis protein TsaB